MGVKLGTIRHNSQSIIANDFYKFDKATGLFGEHVSGNRYNVRVIFTENDSCEEAKKMFAQLTKNATISIKANGNVIHAELSDGTTVDLRLRYPPGHEAAVQIDVSSVKDSNGIQTQKIHFIERKKIND